MNAVFYLLIAAAAAGLLAGGIIILVEGRSPGKSDPGPGRRPSLRRRAAPAPLAGTNPEVDPLLVNLRLGQAALRLGDLAEADRAFRAARSVNANDFEANYNLGLIEFQRRRYAPAAGYLTAARAQSPDHPAANRYLGVSLYLLKAYPEAVR
ncbi:MAG: tetratricopeptide repeat protein, partial [Spirochaetales bacterium]|nr:tetratricopeptide repeat protein [Spirochaetales bacterium]